MAGNGAVARSSVMPPGPPVASEPFSRGSAGAATAFHAKRNAMAARRNRAHFRARDGAAATLWSYLELHTKHTAFNPCAQPQARYFP